MSTASHTRNISRTRKVVTCLDRKSYVGFHVMHVWFRVHRNLMPSYHFMIWEFNVVKLNFCDGHYFKTMAFG